MRNINSFLDSFIYSDKDKEPEDIVHDICKAINQELQNRFSESMKKRHNLPTSIRSDSVEYQALEKQTNLFEKLWDAWSRKTLR